MNKVNSLNSAKKVMNVLFDATLHYTALFRTTDVSSNYPPWKIHRDWRKQCLTFSSLLENFPLSGKHSLSLSVDVAAGGGNIITFSFYKKKSGNLLKVSPSIHPRTRYIKKNSYNIIVANSTNIYLALSSLRSPNSYILVSYIFSNFCPIGVGVPPSSIAWRW